MNWLNKWIAHRNTQRAPITQAQLRQKNWSGGGFVIDIAVNTSPIPPGGDMLKNVFSVEKTADINTSSATFAATDLTTTNTHTGTKALVFVEMNWFSTAPGVTMGLRINRDAGAEYKVLSGTYCASGIVSTPGQIALFTGLTPGAHTFTLEWKTTSTANNNPTSDANMIRRMIVLDCD